MERLANEIMYLNSQTKAMLSDGIEYPEGEGPEIFTGDRTYGATVSKEFPSFEAKIFIPELGLKNAFPAIKFDQAHLVATYEKKKRISRLKDFLTFMTRATELAHYNAPDRLPHWIKGVEWESGFNEPRGRIEWDRLKLFQPEVGKHAVSILKRTTIKADQVAAD